MLRKLRYRLQRLQDFLTLGIWELETATFSKVKSRLLRHLKVVLITVRDFNRQDVGWQAVALSFFTTMAFVPMIAVMFAVTNGLGLDSLLRDLAYRYFAEYPVVLDTLMDFVDNIMASARSGPYGMISFLTFIWLVIWLMLCVEKAFNRIWKVDVSRVFWKRMMTYLLILVLSPFVLILFLTIGLELSRSFEHISPQYVWFDYLGSFLSWTVFYGVAACVLCGMYLLIPNARVRFRPALSSALIAALAFTLVQFLYVETQLMVSRLNAVYGVFAAIPLFMVWVNIGWFIILTGAEVAFALQFVDIYPEKEPELQMKLLLKQQEKNVSNGYDAL